MISRIHKINRDLNVLIPASLFSNSFEKSYAALIYELFRLAQFIYTNIDYPKKNWTETVLLRGLVNALWHHNQ